MGSFGDLGGFIMKRKIFHHHPVNDRRDYYRHTYLRSEHWRNLKQRVLGNRPFCQVCGRRDTLDVHHRTYRDLYNVNPQDLVVLCRRHHDLVHLSTSRLRGGMKELVLEHRLELMLAVAQDFKALICELPSEPF